MGPALDEQPRRPVCRRRAGFAEADRDHRHLRKGGLRAWDRSQHLIFASQSIKLVLIILEKCLGTQEEGKAALFPQ